MNPVILVATHKPYRMPKDSIYLPVHVGRAGRQGIGFIDDDTGPNISGDNRRFCALTGIYWAWKNLSADYVGFVHYRRHFTRKPLCKRLGRDKFAAVLSRKELIPLPERYPLFLPKPRKYYIETMYSHYVHLPYVYERDLQTLQQVIGELAPDDLPAFDAVMKRTSGHLFNMFIMRWEEFDAYRELPVIFMERQNWLAKGGRFLFRKRFPKRRIGGQRDAKAV